ncbi:MAG: hypothetical protein ACXVCP_02510 [Bdellovibrio sp.]
MTDNAKPATHVTGDLFVATDTKRIYRYNVTVWDQSADAASTGGITTGPGPALKRINPSKECLIFMMLFSAHIQNDRDL